MQNSIILNLLSQNLTFSARIYYCKQKIHMYMIKTKKQVDNATKDKILQDVRALIQFENDYYEPTKSTVAFSIIMLSRRIIM